MVTRLSLVIMFLFSFRDELSFSALADPRFASVPMPRVRARPVTADRFCAPIHDSRPTPLQVHVPPLGPYAPRSTASLRLSPPAERLRRFLHRPSSMIEVAVHPLAAPRTESTVQFRISTSTGNGIYVPARV